MKKRLKKLPFILTTVIECLLFVSVFFLMNYVQNLLYSDVKINLTEIVTQNKDVISNRLSVEMNNMSMVASQISDEYAKSGIKTKENLRNIFAKYIADKQINSLFMATGDGIGSFANGYEIDVSGRQYFRLGIDGKQNISERMVSRLNGEEIFVICTPLECDGKIIGTIQKWYTPQEMYKLCSISLFSEQGYMYIINSQGYILIGSEQEGYSLESDNYFRQLYLSNPEASRILKEDISQGKSGFMENEINGKKYFSAYTQLEDIYDWYLVSSVATNAVSPNASIVIRMFYVVLTAVVLIFAVTIFYLLILRNKQQANLRRIAFIDKVTGGDTYAKFVYELEVILQERNAENLCIYSFDIDNFKYINSYYGFKTGDQILKKLYHHYKEQLEEGEQIARVYGDHFVMLLIEASEEKLTRLFEPELSYDGITIYLTAGLYPITDGKESIGLMVDKANTAKRRGKGIRYKKIEVFSEEVNQHMMRNEQIKRSVERALEEKEIIPYFQAKVDVDTRKLVGAEALARWKPKEGKLISPGDFIPVCEETGLIVPVDMAIFEQTLQFIRKNLDLGVECVPISVNFSRTHFLNRDFLEIILSKIDKYQIPTELIEVEITETAVFDNYQLIETFIENLHKHGLRISMDDFGSGYSSLHMIKDIDIDVIKIDRGFLMETANSQKQKTVFAAITQMAKGLDIKIVVEGVENMDNIEMMKESGCTIAQGFYFAQPVSEEEFQKICEEGYV